MKRASGLLGAAVLVAACGGAMQAAPSATGGSATAATPSCDGGPGACGASGDHAMLGGSADGGGPGAAPVPDAGPAPAGLLGPGNTPAPELKSPVPSVLVPDLQALGLDLAHLPPIEKLDPKALRGVMKLMAKSLGIKCADCHKEGDFAAPTRRKKIAAKMWDEFVVKLAFAAPDGAPLFCDSCHQGRVEQLDRHDKKALSKWMDDNFVAKLKQKDGGTQECETCHVDMEMQFLTLWAR